LKITILAPSEDHPVGGALSLYGYANGLSRRGHAVHIAHIPWMDCRIEGLHDLEWFRFEPGITHSLCRGADDPRIPEADFVIHLHEPTPARCGLPLTVIQGYGILPKAMDDAWFHLPCPKICVSQSLVEELVRRGVPRDQLTHVPLGVELEKYRVVTPLEQRPLQVAMPYYDFWMKGGKLGCKALADVKARIPDVDVVMFATIDPDEPLPSWVTFVRSPPQDVLVREIYNGSRVFVAPSVREGFGLPPIEAMACGCALVITDNGGSRDYAIHERTALVSEPRDVASMAGHIESLLTDDDARLALARRGLEFVRGFTWDESARRLETLMLEYAADPAAWQRT
jgi:glycosyltransferase involved in cell wall biosynthesis